MPKERAATTIGPTIIIRGRLTSAEDLIVQGRIDAEIHSTKALQIEETGIVKADVQVNSVRIRGILVGNIHATERVEIASQGRVVGDIHTPILVINDGAKFRGKVDMPNFDEARPALPVQTTTTEPAPALTLAAGEATPDEQPAPGAPLAAEADEAVEASASIDADASADLAEPSTRADTESDIETLHTGRRSKRRRSA